MSSTVNNLLVVLATAFTAGIWCAGLYAVYLPLLYCLGLIATGAVFWFARRRAKAGWLLYALTALFFFAGAIRYLQTVSVPVNDVSLFADQDVILHGQVVERQELGEAGEEPRLRYIVEAWELTKPDHGKNSVMPVTGKVSLSVKRNKVLTEISYGDRIRIAGTVIGLHGYNNPGAINTVAALQREGIRARLLPAGPLTLVEPAGRGISWQAWRDNWRRQVVAAMEKTMPAPEAAILSGMIFGGYQGINREVIADFQTTGLVHILSVSGTHIALVGAAVLWLGRRFKLRPGLIAVITAIAVTGYAVIAGLTAPVLRSLLMGLTGLAAVVWKREKDVAAAFGLSLLLMLALQPELIYDVSFQLSFACTAGLILFYAKTMQWLQRLPKRLAQVAAATFAVQLAALPLTAWYFSNYSFCSFAANFIVVPVVEGIVIAGLVGVLFVGWAPALAGLVFAGCSLCLGAVLQATAWLAALPAASIYFPPLNGIAWLVYYMFLFWLYGYFPRPVMLPLEIWRRWPGRVQVFIVAAALAWAAYLVYPRPVVIHFIDVGQGDAAVITTPHGRAVMVDTGGAVGSASFDLGEQVVYPYLRHYGITELDYLFLTHGHQDHAGGAAAILNHIPVKCVLMAREAEYTQAEKAVLYHRNRQAVIPQYQGQRIELDGVTFTVVYAPAAGRSTGAGNETSTVIRVAFGDQSILFTGDLEAPGEAEILAEKLPIQSNLLKVGHHGSRTSSTAAFLQAVAPQVAVISVGYHNSFGHPHAETLARLAAGKTRVYRTDRSGAVRVVTDGQTMTVNPYLYDE